MKALNRDAIRQRAKESLRAIRDDAKKRGLDRMTMPEIDVVIAESRRERTIPEGRVRDAGRI